MNVIVSEDPGAQILFAERENIVLNGNGKACFIGFTTGVAENDQLLISSVEPQILPKPDPLIGVLVSGGVITALHLQRDKMNIAVIEGIPGGSVVALEPLFSVFLPPKIMVSDGIANRAAQCGCIHLKVMLFHAFFLS